MEERHATRPVPVRTITRSAVQRGGSGIAPGAGDTIAGGGGKAADGDTSAGGGGKAADGTTVGTRHHWTEPVFSVVTTYEAGALVGPVLATVSGRVARNQIPNART